MFACKSQTNLLMKSTHLSFSGWLEASFQEELDTGNPRHEEHARVLVIELVQQLETKAAETDDFLTKNKLDQIVENFKVRHFRLLLGMLLHTQELILLSISGI